LGHFREQLAIAASELTAAEREAERLEDAVAEVTALQESIERWIEDAGRLVAPELGGGGCRSEAQRIY